MRRSIFVGLVNYRCMQLAHGLSALSWAARPSSEVWRPTTDDVDRISWGRPAKRKGTGSRGVPHRLNDEERVLFDFARGKGFLEVSGSGWRRERADAPLCNTYRSWCDARAVAYICVHKGGQSGRGSLDELVLDLSPLRVPEAFADAAAFCLEAEGAADGIVNGLEAYVPQPELTEDEEDKYAEDAEAEEAPIASGAAEPATSAAAAAADPASAILAARAGEYASLPIYRLPRYTLSWARPRSEAKALAKALAARLGTVDPKAKPKGRGKGMGGPRVKAGRSRKHGGYGIEG